MLESVTIDDLLFADAGSWKRVFADWYNESENREKALRTLAMATKAFSEDLKVRLAGAMGDDWRHIKVLHKSLGPVHMENVEQAQ
ncbi:MAG: hypothetical protein ACYTAF_15955, partial [Planctomycetota bacterium]